MQLLSSLRLYFPVHSYKSILDHELCIHSGLYKSGFFQCLSQFDEFILFANLYFCPISSTPRFEPVLALKFTGSIR